MFSPLRTLWVIVLCVLVLTSLTPVSYSQNVTTWHNDTYRTGWQQNETILTHSNVSGTNTFGLLWQWNVTGDVYAQPLAVTLNQSINGCNSNMPPCSLVFIATEQNWLYAFDAGSSSGTAVWSRSLGASVSCSGSSFGPCSRGYNGTNVGITGTPVIDLSASPKTLYVAAAVQGSSSISYELFAVNIITGAILGSTTIGGTVDGWAPVSHSTCDYSNPTVGETVSFDSNHAQRASLLLVGSGSSAVVYVAFSPSGGLYDPEFENGWLFGYSFSGTGFPQPIIFNSTPWGTGGGMWGSGAGPAYDGSSIYTSTGNGTFSYDTPGDEQALAVLNYGDSLVRLNPSSLSVLDYYTPSDVLSYNSGQGLCKADKDLASGGVLAVPPMFFTYNGMNILINADKQSNVYVANSADLGQYNPSATSNIETVLTPCKGNPCVQPLTANQGYWVSPAYWNDGTNSWVYYSPVNWKVSSTAPYPIYGYELVATGTTGPIPQTATAQTTAANDLFCQTSPTPSVSSNSASLGNSGIVWAIENGNSDNPPGIDCGGATKAAALHAVNATTLASLYNSRNVATPIGVASSFSVPTIFEGRVYVGTTATTANNRPAKAVSVFGLCNSQGGGCEP
ncbi:MAG TPA: hypothetical protein VN950_03355 [Terriglobales bacterium]|nr:hypothetical protein [Terriglobales bacterium]